MSAESPRQPYCSPEVRSAIAHLETQIADVLTGHDTASIQTALDLIMAGKLASFAEFEVCLREMGSRLHFIAMPLSYALDPNKVVCPWAPDGKATHITYVASSAMHAQEAFERFDITPTDNLDRLQYAGYTVHNYS